MENKISDRPETPSSKAVMLTVNAILWHKFMKMAANKVGIQRGAQKKVVEEAIVFWIESNKKYDK